MLAELGGLGDLGELLTPAGAIAGTAVLTFAAGAARFLIKMDREFHAHYKADNEYLRAQRDEEREQHRAELLELRTELAELRGLLAAEAEAHAATRAELTTMAVDIERNRRNLP